METLLRGQRYRERVLRQLAQPAEKIRCLHYSPRTEDVYVYWVKKLIRFRQMRHPFDRRQTNMEACLGYLATRSTSPNSSTFDSTSRPIHLG